MKFLYEIKLYLIVLNCLIGIKVNCQNLSVTVGLKPKINNIFLGLGGSSFVNSEPEYCIYYNNFYKYFSLKSFEKFEINLPNYVDKTVFRVRYSSTDYFEFLVNRDDSILVSYKLGKPCLDIFKKSTTCADLTLEESIKTVIYDGKMTSIQKYFNVDFFVDYTKPMNVIEENISKKKYLFFTESINDLNTEIEYLDSLHGKKIISFSYYWFYKSRALLLENTLKVMQRKISLTEAASRLRELSKIIPNNLPNIYINKFSEALVDNYISKRVKVLDLKDGFNRDYREIYSQIKSSDIFIISHKNWLLTREFRRIANTFGKDDFMKFYAFFQQDVQDSVLQNAIREEFALQLMPETNNKIDVTLIRSDKTTATLSEVLKQQKGKVVYVDFWASWCAPCREGMKVSASLRQELANKSISFVYLSIDKTITPWQSANEKEGLGNYPETYLVTESVGSKKFWSEQKLNTIPRYMIFDKLGKLVFGNAPRVESKELKSLLLKLAQ
jgi:thiol-disulfide isomerase/thioredoxin